MELPMTLIKYGLLTIVLLVASYKLWIVVQKLVKKLKGDDMDMDLEVKS